VFQVFLQLSQVVVEAAADQAAEQNNQVVRADPVAVQRVGLLLDLTRQIKVLQAVAA
jgi:hypothetical protein